MKMKLISMAVMCAAFFTSCSDELELRVPYPNNITLNELTLERSSHVVPEGGFSSQGIHFNTVKGADGQLEAGFCYSNRMKRSLPWNGDELSIDSMRYSVYNARPNDTGTYAVCRVKGGEAYFTLDTPSVIQYILVANDAWSYFAMLYGDKYCKINEETGEEEPVENPGIPSKPKGIWYTYVPGGVKKFDKEDKDFFRLTAKGFQGGKETGSVTFDLACKGANVDNPNWDYIISKWGRMDLVSLGVVDKVVFYLESSDKDADGRMRTPEWFCLDGIQLQNQ